jgi:type II secretory pathway pseudopilin PulG
MIHDSRFMKGRGGFTLIELVVYAALVSVVGGIILGLMIPMYRAGAEARISRRINTSGALMMERLLREAKDAESINTASSTFGTHPGIFTLNTTNASTTGGTVKFSLSSGRGVLTLGDNSSQFLTGSQTHISELVFWRLVASSSEGVRIELTISDTSAASSTRTRTFYGSAVLRGSYISK